MNPHALNLRTLSQRPIDPFPRLDQDVSGGCPLRFTAQVKSVFDLLACTTLHIHFSRLAETAAQPSGHNYPGSPISIAGTRTAGRSTFPKGRRSTLSRYANGPNDPALRSTTSERSAVLSWAWSDRGCRLRGEKLSDTTKNGWRSNSPCWTVVNCQISDAAMDKLAGMKATESFARQAQFLSLRSTVEQIASDLFDQEVRMNGYAVRIFTKHISTRGLHTLE
jgi:hypothetical protein